MSTTSIQRNFVASICMGLIFGFRALAIHWRLEREIPAGWLLAMGLAV
jgi:hypothetical protein